MAQQHRAAIEDPVAVIRCLECDCVASGTADGWKAFVSGGFDDEPLEVIIYCASCAVREFDIG